MAVVANLNKIATMFSLPHQILSPRENISQDVGLMITYLVDIITLVARNTKSIVVQ
jgi:hypothetical protein